MTNPVKTTTETPPKRRSRSPVSSKASATPLSGAGFTPQVVDIYADWGNGNIKAIVGETVVVQSAIVARVGDSSSYNCDVFQYRGGDSPTILEGDSWLVGEYAILESPYTAVRVGDVGDNAGKPDYCLQQLASLFHPDRTGASYTVPMLAVTVPDPSLLGKEMTAALLGKHQFSRNKVDFSVQVQSVEVFPEGHGVIAYAVANGLMPLDETGFFYSIDIGHGTIILSAYRGKKELISFRRVLNGSGVRALYTAIAQDSELRSALTRPPSAFLIEQSIIRGLTSDDAVWLYAKTNIDLKPYYDKHFNPWIMSWYPSIFQSLGQQRDNLNLALIVGGGANIFPRDWTGGKLAICPAPTTASIQGIKLYCESKKR